MTPSPARAGAGRAGLGVREARARAATTRRVKRPREHLRPAAFAVAMRSIRPAAPVLRYSAFLASFAFTRPATVGMTETSTIPTISSSKCSWTNGIPPKK